MIDRGALLDRLSRDRDEEPARRHIEARVKWLRGADRLLPADAG